MQSQKEQLADLAACRDKFLVRRRDDRGGASQLDLLTFQKAGGRPPGKLRVAYTTSAMPPTVSEGLASLMARRRPAAANNGEWLCTQRSGRGPRLQGPAGECARGGGGGGRACALARAGWAARRAAR